MKPYGLFALVLSATAFPAFAAVSGCGESDGTSDGGSPTSTSTTTSTTPTSTGTTTAPPGTDGGPTPDASVPDAASFPDPLAGVAAATLIKGGYRFLEGPQWLPADGKLVFSDVQGDRIYQLVPPATDATDFRNPSAGANGNAIDKMAFSIPASTPENASPEGSGMARSRPSSGRSATSP